MIQLENRRQLSGKLQQLSITGGVLDLATYLEERSWIDLSIYLDCGIVRATAEMMFPMRGGVGYLQPFRFTSLGEEELHMLDREVTELLKRAIGPVKPRYEPGMRPTRFHLESH